MASTTLLQRPPDPTDNAQPAPSPDISAGDATPVVVVPTAAPAATATPVATTAATAVPVVADPAAATSSAGAALAAGATALAPTPTTLSQAPDPTTQPWLSTGANDSQTASAADPPPPDLTGRSGSRADQWLTNLMNNIQSQSQPGAGAATTQAPATVTAPPAAQQPATTQPRPLPTVQPTTPRPTVVAPVATPKTPAATARPTQPPAAAAAAGTSGLKAGAPALPANSDVATYPNLAANKRLINAALDALHASPSERQTVLAIAMQETHNMDPAERDTTKTGASTNYSQFNLSQDLLQALGFTGDPSTLNDSRNLSTTVGLMLKGIRTMGESRFLNFVRGGRTGYNDGVSYDCAGYRTAIAALKAQFQYDPSLLTDDRRVEIPVPHQ